MPSPQGASEIAEYIHESLTGLGKLAHGDEFRMLRYLLLMAALEAHSLIEAGPGLERSAQPSRSTRD